MPAPFPAAPGNGVSRSCHRRRRCLHCRPRLRQWRRAKESIVRLFERSKKGLVPEAAGGIMVISGAGAARAGTAQVAAAPVHAEPSFHCPR
jgi:hypothetical protein